MKNLSYIKLDNLKAKVSCPCGWESDPFQQGPFDPGEALMAYSIEHLKCNESHPAVYYAIAQEILRVLGDLEQGPNAREKMEEIAKDLVPEGKTMQVIEIKISSSWVG